MSSRLILKLEVDGETVRNVRTWVPGGDAGLRIFEFAHRLLSTLQGVRIEYPEVKE